MSHHSMSINQMLQPTTKSDQYNGKVKIFYNFKGSDTHCLCSFDTKLNDIKQQKWVNISLKQCLDTICSSCPDQLMDSNTAIYSANFEESVTKENWSPLHDSKSNIIWEGHGALTAIMNDEHSQPSVAGKLVVLTDPSSKYSYYVEVLIQLHPIRQPNPTPSEYQQNYLPPMKSIWSDSTTHYSSSPPSVQTDHSPTLLNNSRNDTPRLPPFLPPKEQLIYPHQPPASAESSWDPYYESTELTKRRKLSSHSPPVITKPLSFDPSTYYHQSRRKKRDTKPPNANDIRPFIEIEKKTDGTYNLPAEVDSWTVIQLGHVIWDKAAFHNQRYIYPVGYRVKKWYRSMVDPHSDTQYTCEILDGGDEPIFQLKADDNPSECWRGPTPTTVWTIAVRRAFAIRNMDYGHNPVGPDFFGLRKNTIAKMIQDLPNADKCKNYIWQNFEVVSNNKSKSVRRSNVIKPISSFDTITTLNAQ